MRFAWASTVRELRRLRRDPFMLATWIGVPLFAGLMMMVIFGGETVTPKGTLLVADEDGSFVSSLVSMAFGQGPLAEMITVEKVDLADGRKRMNRGKASALLHIPKGFGTAVLEGTPTKLALIKNPSQTILPDIIEEVVALLPEAGFYLQALAGDRLRTFTAGRAPADATVAETAVAFNRLGTAISAYLDPLRIDLVDATPPKPPDAGRDTFAASLLRGMILLGVMFLGLGFSGEVWKERRQGTLQRLLSTPARVEGFLLGRCMALAAVAGVTAVLGLAIASRVESAAAWRIALGVVFVMTAAVGLYLVFQLLALLAPSERAASIVANVVMFPLAMLGGTFFPFEVLPKWMGAVGRWTPNGWAVTQFGALMEGSLDAARVAGVFGAALAAAALVFVLVAWRLRRGFAV